MLIQTKDQCLVIGTIEYANISCAVLTATPTSCPPILSPFYHHSTCCWFRKLSCILPLEIELTKGAWVLSSQRKSKMKRRRHWNTLVKQIVHHGFIVGKTMQELMISYLWHLPMNILVHAYKGPFINNVRHVRTNTNKGGGGSWLWERSQEYYLST